jgi:hypothetical protein
MSGIDATTQSAPRQDVSMPEHGATVATPGSIVRLVLTLAMLQVPAWLGRAAVSDAVAIWPLAGAANPYYLPAHFIQLYVWTPAVIVSAIVMLLAPGLVIARAFGVAASLERWLLTGFAISLVLVSAVSGSLQAMAGQPLVGTRFMAAVVACFLGGSVFLLYRARQNRIKTLRLDTGSMLALFTVPWALLVAFAPKFYWENFNGDGAHAFESSRLLLHQGLPFWHDAAGEIAAFPGVTSMLFAFPGAWFIRLFGELEVAARIPVLLYLVVLFCALIALIESGRSRPLRSAERWLLWAALGVYFVVVAYSATYSAYSADLALPATQDTLLVACLLAFILGFVEARIGWMFAWGLLTFFSLPNGLLLLACWGAAVTVTWRPLPWRRLWWLVGLGVACVVVSAAAPKLLGALGLPAPGDEYGAGALAGYFEELRITDWRRFAFAIVPGGILPGIALLAWRWQDQVARAITLVTLASFLFFYVQAATALHYYIPAMILPLVVYWRLRPVVNDRPAWVPATAVGILLALLWSWPTSPAIETNARVVGAAIALPDTSYRVMDPVAIRRASVLRFVFPYDWNPAVPDSTYGGSPLVWNYYANRHMPAPGEANYIIQQTSLAPVDGRKAGELGSWAVYIRNDSIWRAHRALRPTARPGSPLYWIPQHEKFR